MGKSPSALRREGREAFDPQTDPSDVYPYWKTTGGSEWENYLDWMDGWTKAAKSHEQEESQKQEDYDDWELESSDCPWHCDDLDTCDANDKFCTYKNCAPWYFKRQG